MDASGASALAVDDPYQFQWWALGQVGARPTEQKKGADKGIDGRLYFHDFHDEGKAPEAKVTETPQGSLYGEEAPPRETGSARGRKRK
jgi:hypothetical protein